MANPTTDSIMFQTLTGQPDDLRRVLADGWGPARDAARLIGDARRIFITGVGTSYHASLAGGWLLRAAGRDARAVLSYDFATYPESYPLTPDDAVIVMAHTGVKSYSKLALDRAVEAGAAVVSVGSRAAEHPGSQLVLRTIDRETSAAYTSSHLTAMATLAMVADELGVPSLRTHLEAMPDQIADIIDRQAQIRPVAERAAGRKVYAFGGGPSEVTALELVIKAREAALHPVDGLQTEQFFHGPIVAVNAGDFAVVVNPHGEASLRTGAIATAFAEIGGEVWVVGESIPALPDAPTFRLPIVPEILSMLLSVVPIQLFAYHLAATKGTHPDTFRRHDPTYKDAFALLTL